MVDAQTLAAKAAQALTDATAGLSNQETERLAGATSLTLALEDAGSWTLRWDEATSKPQLVAGEEDGAVCGADEILEGDAANRFKRLYRHACEEGDKAIPNCDGKEETGKMIDLAARVSE